MKRSLIGAVAIGASLLVMTGCATSGSSDSSTGSAGKPINVTVLFGETGATAAYAKAYVNGVNSAVDTINANGGVNGRQINATIVDDGTDPTKAVSIVTQAVNSDSPPDAIIPGATTAEALALLPILTSKQIFSVSAAASSETNDPSKYPYHFGQSASQADSIQVVGDDLKSKGYKSIAVVTSADAFGDAVLQGFTQIAQQDGLNIVDTERPSATALDYTVEMQRVKDSKPDAVFYDMQIPDAAGRVLTARDTVGGTDVPIYGGTAVGSVVMSSLVSASATQNCQMPAYSYTVKGLGGSYLDPMYQKFVGGTTGVFSGGLGWDSIQLIATAFKSADGKTSATDLANALQSTPVPANTLALFPGGTSFSATNHFPTITPGSRQLIPCSSTVQDGLWITQ